MSAVTIIGAPDGLSYLEARRWIYFCSDRYERIWRGAQKGAWPLRATLFRFRQRGSSAPDLKALDALRRKILTRFKTEAAARVNEFETLRGGI
jgi:hypothetical protein